MWARAAPPSSACPQGTTISLDGGSKGSPAFDLGERVLAPFLWKNRVWRLDEVVVTHPDSDHYNGLPFVVRRFRPRRLWINGADRDTWPYSGLLRTTAAESGIEIREPGAGEMLKAGEDVQTRFRQRRACRPGKPGAGKPEQQRPQPGSQAGARRIAFLLPGDIQQRGEEHLLAEGKNVQAQVLLAAHHGSKGSSSAPFIAAVNPELIIVSSGRHVQGRLSGPCPPGCMAAAGRRVLGHRPGRHNHGPHRRPKARRSEPLPTGRPPSAIN